MEMDKGELMSKPKILVWDLETGFNQAAIFSLFNKYLPISSILSERYIICGSFKELNTGEVFAVSILDDPERFEADPTDDTYVTKKIHEILSEADAVIAHYGDNFDTKFFNTRALYYGLEPSKTLQQIDTYKIAKSKFFFNSNKLDYIGKFLGEGEKIKTSEQLWLDCLAGKKSAIKEMIRYNKQDVLLLERVYNKLAPWAPVKLNYNTYSKVPCFPLCGHEELLKRGMVHLKVLSYQGYACKKCGHRFRGGKGLRRQDKPVMR